MIGKHEGTLALGRLLEAGSASSWEARGRKAKDPAQAKRGVGDVFFLPAATAPSEKESGPCESVGKQLRSQGCKRMAGERRFKDGTHWGEKQIQIGNCLW